ncbi:MAG: hypothetical protein J3R72DRAFT_528908, partial [Linnemannia gamsii]
FFCLSVLCCFSWLRLSQPPFPHLCHLLIAVLFFFFIFFLSPIGWRESSLFLLPHDLFQ